MAMNRGDGDLRDKHTDTCVLLTSISEFSAVQYVRHSDFFYCSRLIPGSSKETIKQNNPTTRLDTCTSLLNELMHHII